MIHRKKCLNHVIHVNKVRWKSMKSLYEKYSLEFSKRGARTNWRNRRSRERDSKIISTWSTMQTNVYDLVIACCSFRFTLSPNFPESAEFVFLSPLLHSSSITKIFRFFKKFVFFFFYARSSAISRKIRTIRPIAKYAVSIFI